MPPSFARRNPLDIRVTLGVAGACYAAFRLEMLIAFDGTPGALVHPGAGLVFALGWILGRRVWLGAVLGGLASMLLHAGYPVHPGAQVAVCAGLTIGHVLQGLLPALLMRDHVGRDELFGTVRGTWLFIGAAVVSTGLGGLLCAAVLRAFGLIAWSEFAFATQALWSSGLVGVVIVGPLLVHAVQAPRRAWSPLRVLESATALSGQALVAFLAFALWHPDAARMSLALSAIIILFFLWIAWRLGGAITSLAANTTTAAAVWGSALALTRMTAGEPTTLDVARAALLVIGAFALTITAAIVELRASRVRLRQELDRRLQHVIDALPGMVFITGPNKECLEVNQNWIDYRGTTREQELGYGWFQAVHPEDRERMLDDFARYFEVRSEGQLEFRCRGADGDYRWFLANVCPSYDAQGRFSGYTASCVDITDRKSLDQERVELNVAVEHAMTGVARLDEDGRYAHVRRSYAAMLGYREEELIGRPWQVTVVPEDIATVEAAAARAEREGRADTLARGVRKDGSIFHKHVLLITHADGDGAGRYCFMRDVSERVAAEARRAELADQLRQTQKLEAVGTLASGVAHDFNNMLTAIQGHTDAAAVTIASDHEALAHLRGIERAAEQAAGVSQSLLTFSQRTPTERGPIELTAALGDAHGLLRRLLPNSIVSELDAPEQLWIRASPVQLQQVLINLAVNSREAMPDGGRLVIRLRRDPGHALIEVIDSGHGIAPEIRTRILEPFFTTRPRERGTGLGLSIVHGIVRAHDGTLEIESEPGRGTSIRMRFPLCEPADPQAPSATPAARPAASSGLVLVVEDNTEVRRMLVGFLERAGFTVLSAADGDEALEVFRRCEQEINAVVSDLELPKLSGLACVREMRRSVPELPVVLISGNVSQHLSAEDCKRETVLHKPFKMAQLVETVESVITPRPPVRRVQEAPRR